MANTWQGEFPWQNLKPPRKHGTSPVKSFPPNGFEAIDTSTAHLGFRCVLRLSVGAAVISPRLRGF
jgi:hypothetical protein